MHFISSEKAIVGFVNSYLANQGNHNWGMDQNVKNVIIDHNFDVVANMRYAGIYAFMFDVQNQKQHNTYHPTTQEAKLYGYFVEKYPAPVMPTNVTPYMMTQVVQSWKDAANYGNVPYGLFLEEPSFWATTAGNAYCLHYDKCTLEEAKRGFDLAAVAGNQPANSSLTKNSLAVTPFVLTKHYVNHILYANVSPQNNHCDSGNCFYSNSTSGTGILTINPNSGGYHSYDATVLSYSDDYTTDSHGTSVILNLSTTTSVGSFNHSAGPQIGYGSDIINDQVTASRCGSDGNCGLYGVVATGQSAYYWA